MKRIEPPNMTPIECQDELTLDALKRLIIKARKAEQKLDDAQKSVFQALDDMCIDINTPSKSENADNIGDAISCYIQYGEFGLKNIMKEVRAAYTKE